MIDKTPRYNLGMVIRETGIKPDTLRAWERRYGLPIPQRTDGGHRLYSEYDIQTIRWLIERQSEGMRISNIVQHWQILLDEGKDPLEEIQKTNRITKKVEESVSGFVTSELRDKWIEACLTFDEQSADQILSQSFALYPMETVCIEILQKGLTKIGDLWYQNRASVQQEHFASTLAIRRLNALISAAPPPEHPQRTIIACVPGEYHSFPSVMMTLLLRHRGWNVINLGENVPYERMLQTVQSVRANLTILCAMRIETAMHLLEMSQTLHDERTTLAYGGYIFAKQSSLTRRISAHYLGDELTKVPQKVDHLLKNKPLPPAAEPLDEMMAAAFAHFKDHQLGINARVIERMQLSPTLREYIDYAELHLSRKIAAALAFGNLNLLEAEIEQVAELIEHYGYPGDSLGEYLQTYHQVLQENLDQRGAPVIDWLKAYIAKAG